MAVLTLLLTILLQVELVLRSALLMVTTAFLPLVCVMAIWPRLSGLAGPDLSRPAERRGLRPRGPSMSALARLITEIERRA